MRASLLASAIARTLWCSRFFADSIQALILYDNTKIAVARILGDGKRQRTRVFAELQSHYLFQDRFGRPAKGNDKGKVEGLVGFARRNFMVPIPVFATFEALNAHLADCCRKRMGERLRGHTETIGERLQRDLTAMRRPLPPPYDACEKVGTLCRGPARGACQRSQIDHCPRRRHAHPATPHSQTRRDGRYPRGAEGDLLLGMRGLPRCIRGAKAFHLQLPYDWPRRPAR